MTSLGPCKGRCGSLCGYNNHCPPPYTPLVNHHHHHSHFNSAKCGGQRDVPELCNHHNPDQKLFHYTNLDLYHNAMASSYQAERDLKEKQKLFNLGVTGIPFGHSNSVQERAV